MEHLISVKDFVIKQYDELNKFTEDSNKDKAYKFNNIVSYVEFLGKPLSLEMFLPCDLNGKLLLHPDIYDKENPDYSILIEEYNEAKKRVLFKGINSVWDCNNEWKIQFSIEKNSHPEYISTYLGKNAKIESICGRGVFYNNENVYKKFGLIFNLKNN